MLATYNLMVAGESVKAPHDLKVSPAPMLYWSNSGHQILFPKSISQTDKEKTVERKPEICLNSSDVVVSVKKKLLFPEWKKYRFKYRPVA